MSNIQPCNVVELKDTGILLEINRTILHPLGYDMSLCEDTEGAKLVVSKTDDKDGVQYDMQSIPETVKSAVVEKMREFKQLAKQRHPSRKKHCGYVVQPLHV
jgi:hypothetical protein